MLQSLSRKLNASIQAKIAATLLVAVITAVTLTALTSAARETARSFASKRAELTGISSALAASIAGDMKSADALAVGRTLTSIRNIPDVAFAQVLDPEGKNIVQLGNSVVLERHDERVTPNGTISLFSGVLLRNYILETPIVSGGDRIGTLRIIANVSHLRTALRDALISALLAGIIAAAIGLLLAQRLQSRITEPVNRLTATIGNIQRTHDFTTTVPRTSDDETGLMVDAFNDMLHEIRTRDRRLSEHRDRLEIEVDERTRELKAATRAAQSANAAKSEFLATMSHEIRTPLNGMLVMAELLSTADLPDRHQRHAAVIASSGQTLLAIINDILDLSKIEAGRLDLERLPVAPESVAQQVTSLFAARAASKGIDLACYVAPSVPAHISADPVRLNQIIANLVNNALKFTEKGSVTLRIETDGPAPEAGVPCRLRFAVSDTGIGIPEDKVSGIFEPFTQADQSTTRRFGGTGIGLSISKKLVEAMGGEIHVESRLGEGSTFSFTILAETIEPPLPSSMHLDGIRAVVALPMSATRDVLVAMLRDGGLDVVETEELNGHALTARDLLITEPGTLARLVDRTPPAGQLTVLLADLGGIEAASMIDRGRADALLHRPLCRADLLNAIMTAVNGRSSRSPASNTETARPNRGEFRGTHVLAADDNAVNREVLSEALGRLGVQVTLVEDGAAAVGALAERTFDLVLMDLSMPVMDGYAATRAIRAREAEAGAQPIPIVALTAHVAGMHANAWREAGMNDTLTKPFTLKGLASCLARWLQPTRDAVADAPQANPTPSASGSGTLLPVLDQAVLDDIREMQAPGDDLVGRVIGLFRHHAPEALGRLATALQSGENEAVADTAHALKSLCRNIGAARLAHHLDSIEGAARAGTLTGQADLAAEAHRHLEEVLGRLAECCPPDTRATA